jgi:hypothetical protein
MTKHVVQKFQKITNRYGFQRINSGTLFNFTLEHEKVTLDSSEIFKFELC